MFGQNQGRRAQLCQIYFRRYCCCRYHRCCCCRRRRRWCWYEHWRRCQHRPSATPLPFQQQPRHPHVLLCTLDLSMAQSVGRKRGSDAGAGTLQLVGKLARLLGTAHDPGRQARTRSKPHQSTILWPWSVCICSICSWMRAPGERRSFECLRSFQPQHPAQALAAARYCRVAQNNLRVI